MEISLSKELTEEYWDNFWTELYMGNYNVVKDLQETLREPEYKEKINTAIKDREELKNILTKALEELRGCEE